MSLKLPPKLADILREIISERRPDLIQAINASGPLSDEERDSLRQALTDELVASGLREDDEPNERGLQIEELIDRVGRL